MKKTIPQIPYYLLKRLYYFESREGYIGDIEEDFEERIRLEGKSKAMRWIWFHAMAVIPKAFQSYIVSPAILIIV